MGFIGKGMCGIIKVFVLYFDLLAFLPLHHNGLYFLIAFIDLFFDTIRIDQHVLIDPLLQFLYLFSFNLRFLELDDLSQLLIYHLFYNQSKVTQTFYDQFVLLAFVFLQTLLEQFVPPFSVLPFDLQLSFPVDILLLKDAFLLGQNIKLLFELFIISLQLLNFDLQPFLSDFVIFDQFFQGCHLLLFICSSIVHHKRIVLHQFIFFNHVDSLMFPQCIFLLAAAHIHVHIFDITSKNLTARMWNNFPFLSSTITLQIGTIGKHAVITWITSEEPQEFIV